MAFPHSFISMANFELAFTRVVRGQNKEYKNLFRHLYPSYQFAYTEDELVEQPAMGLFAELGWQAVPVLGLRRMRDLPLPPLLSGQMNLKMN